MSLKRIIAIVLLANVLLGCSSDDVIVPNELPEIEQKFNLSPVWSSNVVDGVGRYVNRLKPVVADGVIYVADADGKVVALNAKSGKVVWQQELDLPFAGGIAAGVGHLALGSQDGDVVLLDAKTGAEKWRVKVSSEVLSPPAINAEHVVVKSVDAKITALKFDTGEQVWILDKQNPALTNRGTSAPVLHEGGVFAGFANGRLGVYIESNGLPAWEIKVAEPKGRSELQRMVDVDTTPVIYGSAVYVAALNGQVAAYANRTGDLIWQRTLSTYQNISVSRGLVLVTDAESRVHALTRSSGHLFWTNEDLLNRSLTAATAFGDTIIVGDFEGYVHFLDRKSGKVLAYYEVDDDGIIAEPVVADNMLYVMGRSGTLSAFNLPGK